jgi:hypothetical protein
MRRESIRLTLAIVAGIAFGIATLAVSADSGNDLSGFVGRWQIDPDKTKMGRTGPRGKDILRSNTFTFVFTPDAPGLKMEVYAQYPQPAATRTMNLIADGKARVCPSKTPCMTAGGSPNEQTYAWYQMDAHMLARLFWVKGAMYDYSSLSLSSDNKTLTLISWAPETPYYQNIQVFNKQ